jgi:YfiH family protein
MLQYLATTTKGTYILIEQRYGNLRHVQFEQYQQFPDLIHGIFTRKGGYSRTPYASLNTSGILRGGDNLAHVIQNRQLVLKALKLEGMPCATLWNIHGADVVVFERSAPWRTDWAYASYYEQAWAAEYIHKGDALITRERGVALALSFADCAPIALYDPEQQVIGIAHGGWRGTARGIVFATLEVMRKRFGSRPQDIYAGIGPAIGPCCYEVSQEVQQLFFAQRDFETMPTNERYRPLVRESAVFSTVQLSDQNSLRLDLVTTTYRQLLMAGIRPEHIELADICTSCQKDRFFSHRGEQGKTGRFPLIMALRKA